MGFARYYRAFPARLFRMRPKAFQKDLSDFDAWTYCKTGGVLESSDCALEFPRLEAEDTPMLSCLVERWSIKGRVNAKSECVISLSGAFKASFACVSCGKPVHSDFEFDRKLILKTSEAEADAYDEDELDDNTDVVACPGAVNLRDWLEDEILLACPMFPRHETCEGNVLAQELSSLNTQALQDDTAEEPLQEVQRPFANLADLLKTRKP